MAEITKDITVENADKGPLDYCRAMLDTGTFNVETNSVDVVWGTSTPCLVPDADGVPFWQVLSFDKSHVMLDRLLAGAPVLDNHDRKGSITKIQLGVVENPYIIDGEGRATLRFSKRPEIASFVGDVKDGIIKNISTGFRVFTYRDITQAGDTIRTYLAVKWEPFEISPTGVPEDFRSHIRTLSEIEVPPEIEVAPVEQIPPVEITNENLLNIETRTMEETPEAKTARLATEAAANNLLLGEERTRTLSIAQANLEAKLDPAFSIKHIELGTPIDEFRALVITEMANRQDNPINTNAGYIAPGADLDQAGRLLGFEEGITVRAFGMTSFGTEGPKTEAGKNAANGRRVSLVEQGARILEANGVKTASLSEGEIFTRTMSTTDFPIALSNVMNKNLRQRYQQADPQWMKFAKKVPVKDFKAINSVQVDGNATPGKLTENGEYPNFTLKEAGDKFALDTYGLTTSITRQMFINDDLGAFEKFAPIISDGMIYNQTQLVYAALLGTDGLGRVLLEDNIKVFNAAHNNLGTAAVMSLAAFKDAKTAMRRQVTLAKRKMSGNVPKFLIVPPELEVLASQLINSTITPNTTGTTNPFQGQFEVLVEDFFDNATAWLLIADPNRTESVKYATLDGQEGIFTEQWWEPGKDKWVLKGRNDFSATVEEFRGLYRNPGL